jgi:hypothetical protein
MAQAGQGRRERPVTTEEIRKRAHEACLRLAARARGELDEKPVAKPAPAPPPSAALPPPAWQDVDDDDDLVHP